MRSKDQGLMATLLMFVPLLAVPFVAVWGVPWLAAKSKSESPADLEPSGSSLSDAGVGQSQTRRHGAEDLFAPVIPQPAVDLRFSAENPSAASTQNPHLRNASLVVSREDAWVDPFDEINADTAPGRSSARQSANTSNAAPQQALEDWMGQDAFAETPKPREFEDASADAKASGERNPFAQFESPAGGSQGFQVAVNADAFADPSQNLSISKSGDASDAARTLFRENEPPASANEAAELPPAETPRKPTEPNTLQPPTDRLARNEPPHPPGERVAVSANGDANRAGQTGGAAQPLTWETARARLKEYGIKHFYLQPDPESEMYHFRCAFTPGENSRVNRLFEAEAAEPLEAVRKVLAQVESWTARESAAN